MPSDLNVNCSYCFTPLLHQPSFIFGRCSKCDTPIHLECWQDNNKYCPVHQCNCNEELIIFQEENDLLPILGEFLSIVQKTDSQKELKKFFYSHYSYNIFWDYLRVFDERRYESIINNLKASIPDRQVYRRKYLDAVLRDSDQILAGLLDNFVHDLELSFAFSKEELAVINHAVKRKTILENFLRAKSSGDKNQILDLISNESKTLYSTREFNLSIPLQKYLYDTQVEYWQDKLNDIKSLMDISGWVNAYNALCQLGVRFDNTDRIIEIKVLDNALQILRTSLKDANEIQTDIIWSVYKERLKPFLEENEIQNIEKSRNDVSALRDIRVAIDSYNYKSFLDSYNLLENKRLLSPEEKKICDQMLVDIGILEEIKQAFTMEDDKEILRIAEQLSHPALNSLLPTQIKIIQSLKERNRIEQLLDGFQKMNNHPAYCKTYLQAIEDGFSMSSPYQLTYFIYKTTLRLENASCLQKGFIISD